MKRKSHLLIAFFSCIAIIGLFYFLGMFSGLSSNISIGRVSDNNDDKWHCEFYYLQGIAKGSLLANKDNAQLICSSEIERGTVCFEIYNSKDSCIHSFSSEIGTDTVSGLLKGERYAIKAIAKGAKGSFDIRME